MSRKKGPRSGGPRARRSFTPGQKLELLAGYEQAVAAGDGGAFLRREGLYSSLMTEWRRARDAGLLQAKWSESEVLRGLTGDGRGCGQGVIGPMWISQTKSKASSVLPLNQTWLS